MKYIVTHVSHDFNGYVEGVECLGVFPTQEAAAGFVKIKRDTSCSLWKTLADYLDAFVAEVVIPDFVSGQSESYRAWRAWVEAWPCSSYNVTPATFRQTLRSYLTTHWTNFKHPGFAPPDMTGLNSDQDLFVVEVNCE